MDLPSVLTLSPVSGVASVSCVEAVVGDLAGDPRSGVSSGSLSPGHSVNPRELASSPYYVQLYDNVSSWLLKTCDKDGVGFIISGECEKGHRFVKELVCGKEWCEVCGADDSVAHLRRFARWLPKAQQIKSLGYFNFTLPEYLRKDYRTKKALGGLGHGIQEILKLHGFERGLRRYHWFGESAKYHPHVNALVDGGYVSEDMLDAIKREYAELLGLKVEGLDVKAMRKLVDVNYEYRRSPGQMVHTLKYVLRSTFLNFEDDREMAIELRGFRNMVVWGRGLWDGPVVWGLADLETEAKADVEGLDIVAIGCLQAKAPTCPECGAAVVWGKVLPKGLLRLVEQRLKSYGAGYYRLYDLPPPDPPELPVDVKQRLARLQLVQMARVMDSLAGHRDEERW